MTELLKIRLHKWKNWRNLIPFLVAGFHLSTSLGTHVLKVEIYENQESARIIFEMSDPVHFDKKADLREVVLQFSEPLIFEKSTSSDFQSSNWIERITYGYDVILVKALKNTRFYIHQSGKRLEIQLSSSNQLNTTRKEGFESLQLALLKVQLYIQTDRLGEASSLLNILNRKYPQNADVKGLTAVFQENIQNRRRAIVMYDEALRLEPDNEEYQKAEAELRTRYQPQIQYAPELKTVTNAQTEWISQTRAQYPFWGHTVGGIQYDVNQVDSGPVRLSDGAIGSFSGLKQKAEVYLFHDFERNGTMKTSFTTDGSNAGAGLRYKKPDLSGSIELLLNYRSPNWDFIEGVVNGIYRDRFQFRRYQRFGWNLLTAVSIAGNRYQTQAFGTGATSLGFEANIVYQLPQISLSFEYGVEAEYRQSISQRKDPAGDSYYPVPLISREIHFADANFSKNWTELCRSETFGGFSFDRLGGAGPFIGAHLVCEPRDGLGGTVWMDHRLNTADTNQTVLRIGGSLFWRF